MPDSLQNVKRVAPDKMAALRHVELVTGSPDTEVHVRFLDDAKTGMGAAERHGTIEKLWPEIAAFQRQHYGVFLIPNAGPAVSDFLRDKDIHTIRATFIDADGIAEPNDWHVPPAFLIHSSPGKWHAYWPADDVSVVAFEELQRGLAAHYGTDPKVCNPSRVMRLAGTIHWKDREHPQLAALEDRTEGRDRWEFMRTAAELRAGLPAVEAKKNTAAHSTPRTGVDWDEPQNISRARSYLAAEIKAGRVAIEHDNGNATLLRIALQLRDFLISEARAKELIWADFNAYCRPSWDDPEDVTFAAPIERAYHGGAQNSEAGRDAVGSAGASFGQSDTFRDATSAAREDMAAEPGQDDGAAQSISGEDENEDFDDLPVSAAEYQSGEFPPVKELVPGWIEQGIVTYLEGPAATHKSRMALQDSICLASGKRVFGEDVVRTGGLYLNYENPRDEMKRRVQTMTRKLGWPGSKDKPLDIDVSGLKIWELRDQPRAVLTVRRTGQIMITRFGRRVLRYLAGRHVEGLHTFVVFDGLMDAIIFEGSTRSEDAVAIRIIKLLDRWCVEYGFTAYAIIHPSRAAERLGISGGSYATAWSTKPRAIQAMSKVATKGAGSLADPFYQRRIVKRSHGIAGTAMVLEFSDGMLIEVAMKGNAMVAPAAAEVILQFNAQANGRLRRDGRISLALGEPARKLTSDYGIMVDFRRRTGNDKLQPADLVKAADAACALGLLAYQGVRPGSNASRQGIRAGYCEPAESGDAETPEDYADDPTEPEGANTQ